MKKTILAAIMVLPMVIGCGKPSTSESAPSGSPAGSATSAIKGGTFTFGRTYKVGDKDVYDVKMDQSTGKVTTTMTMTQEVTKVYDNGDADMKDTSADMVMNMDGKTIKAPPQPPITIRIDKYGVPQGGANGNPAGGFGAALSQLKDGIAVGQSVPYDYTNPANSGSHDVGKITYVSADGASKFHIVSDTTNAKGGKSHIEGDMTFDTTTRKPISTDLTITTEGASPNTGHMVMTLKNP